MIDLPALTALSESLDELSQVDHIVSNASTDQLWWPLEIPEVQTRAGSTQF
jgi:hypothetical protein